MINNLQPFLVFPMLLIGLYGYSQQGNDTLVQKNRQKIETLMKELENLEKMEKSFSIGTDDCEKQTFLLSSQIVELQNQLKNDQSEVQRLTSLLSEIMSKEGSSNNGSHVSQSSKNAENETPYTEVINKSYYVVLKSFRNQNDAERWTKKNNMTGVSLKRNLKKTWFHAVMEQQVRRSEVGKIVYKKQKNGFADAWWKEEEYFE